LTENLKKLIEYRFGQAQETLAVARELLGSGHFRDAVNRGYYAMFYCGLGLLAAKNLGTSKHSGVLSLFSQHFVRTGEISTEAGQHLRQAFELRQNCDYREFVSISKEQVEEVLVNAAAFIKESKLLFEKLSAE
jgi:uncharacterized protein (UPF0332 family)